MQQMNQMPGMMHPGMMMNPMMQMPMAMPQQTQGKKDGDKQSTNAMSQMQQQLM